jgi:hypothetical protein
LGGDKASWDNPGVRAFENGTYTTYGTYGSQPET